MMKSSRNTNKNAFLDDLQSTIKCRRNVFQNRATDKCSLAETILDADARTTHLVGGNAFQDHTWNVVKGKTPVMFKIVERRKKEVEEELRLLNKALIALKNAQKNITKATRCSARIQSIRATKLVCNSL
jgi:hypothetical protein